MSHFVSPFFQHLNLIIATSAIKYPYGSDDFRRFTSRLNVGKDGESHRKKLKSIIEDFMRNDRPTKAHKIFLKCAKYRVIEVYGSKIIVEIAWRCSHCDSTMGAIIGVRLLMP